MEMKKISIVTGTFNEEKNVFELYTRLKKVFEQLPQYEFDITVEDNLSKDGTRKILRKIAAGDSCFKVIFNANNFGVVRSGTNNLLSSQADATIMMCSDLQEPPEMIPEFIKKWEEGYKVVCAVKKNSRENPLMFPVRKLYYRLLASTSETPLISNFTGFGLYDRCFVDALKKYHEPYPYFRGLVSEIGFRRCEIPYTQERRRHGRSSYNFFSYYDFAMTGFVNHTKLPLRLAVFAGLLIGFFSFLTAMAYLILKLIYWDTFNFGMAPLMIGLFFFSSVQLFFIGILGEYIGAIWTQVKNKPYVIEEERINFDRTSQAKESERHE